MSPRSLIRSPLRRPMPLRRRAALLVLLLACAARPAAAQEAPAEVRTGRWPVRLVAPSAGFTELVRATLLEVRGDSMMVEISGMRKTVAVADVTRLQRMTGLQNRAVNAAIGALGGGLAGYGAGMLRQRWSISGDDQRPAFTAVGVLLGALLGARFLEGSWHDVPGYVAVAPIAPVPAEPGAVALGLELRF